MLKVYTRDAHFRLIGSFPSLWIKEDGFIYPDNYELDHYPCGKVDFQNKLVYGENYYETICTPVAEYTQDGNEIRVYKYPRTHGDVPFLYIENDRIFGSNDYHSTVKTPCGYIKREEKKQPETGTQYGGGSPKVEKQYQRGGGNPGLGCGVPLWMLLIGAFALYLIALSAKFLFVHMTGMGVSLVACALFAFLTVKIGSVTHLENDQAAVAQSKNKANSSAMMVALACGAVWCYTVFSFFTKSGDRTDVLLLVLATAVGFTLASFYVAKLYFYRRYLKEFVGVLPTSNKRQQQWSNGGMAGKENKTTIKKNDDAQALFNKTFDNAAIVRCPYCGAKCRVSRGGGPRTVICPKPSCKAPFSVDL